jgi:putative transposase
MPSVKFDKKMSSGSFFITLTVKNWYYIFDRHNRWEIIADSLEYCQRKKGLKLFGFVFMLNHIHLVIMSDDALGFVRDFKKFTSKKLRENIELTEPSIVELFLNEDGSYNFWKSNNMPKVINSEKFLLQKIEYIHNNPVRKRYVDKAEDWHWSSANPNCRLRVDALWD